LEKQLEKMLRKFSSHFLQTQNQNFVFGQNLSSSNMTMLYVHKSLLCFTNVELRFDNVLKAKLHRRFHILMLTMALKMSWRYWHLSSNLPLL
jgi:hypothetical protein